MTEANDLFTAEQPDFSTGVRPSLGAAGADRKNRSRINQALSLRLKLLRPRTGALRRIVLTLIGCALAWAASLHAADDWRPPSPTGNDGFDWIELRSGEWLKGKIKSLQDEKLEFDSEELDLHT